jgi:hypothetical protein
VPRGRVVQSVCAGTTARAGVEQHAAVALAALWLRVRIHHRILAHRAGQQPAISAGIQLGVGALRAVAAVIQLAYSTPRRDPPQAKLSPEQMPQMSLPVKHTPGHLNSTLANEKNTRAHGFCIARTSAAGRSRRPGGSVCTRSAGPEMCRCSGHTAAAGPAAGCDRVRIPGVGPTADSGCRVCSVSSG